MGSTHGYAGLFVSARHFWQAIPRGESGSSPRLLIETLTTDWNEMTQRSRKPYTLVGAEQLTASVYKTGDELIGFHYRFNIIRVNNRTGRVNQWFTPDDLCAMVKLARVLAAELADDGCINPELRNQLIRLAAALDNAIAEVSPAEKIYGGTNP